jgi:O-antigen ligase/Flp pilus assembly protein TadD
VTRPEVVLCLSILLLAPLAFGAVEPWSLAVMETGCLFALALALRRRTHGGTLRLDRPPGLLPLGLFLAFVAAQLAPLPPAVVGLVAPRTLALYQETLGAAGPLPWIPLSLDPLATLGQLLRFGAYAACYVLAVQILSRWQRLRPVVWTLVAFAALLSFLALLQSIVAPTRLLFLRTPAEGHPFGPYVNRNHYANLMAMLSPIVFALFLFHRPPGQARTLRERLVHLLARPEANTRLLLGFAALLCGASLVLSLSRGATVGVCLAMLLLGGLLVAHGPDRRRALATMVFFAALVVFVGWFGWDRVIARFAQSLRQVPEGIEAVRLVVWRDTLAMIRAFPLFGSGMGTFARVYPRFRTLPGVHAVDHAHNDYLELLADGGLVGAGLFAWFVAAALRATLRAARRRREPFALSLALGTVAGVVAFLVHALSDFSLAIGANGLYFFFLLALGVSAAHTRPAEAEGRTLLRRTTLPAGATVAAFAVAAAALLFHAGTLAARHAYRLAGVEARATAGLPSPAASVTRLLELAGRFQPLEADYPAARARAAAQAGRGDEAVALTARALRRRPTDPDLLMQLGRSLGAGGDAARARRAYAAAVAFDPQSRTRLTAYGSWLLARGERAAGIAQLRAALALDPRRAPEVFSVMVLAGLADAEIAAAVPRDPVALLLLARYLEATGADDLARAAYRDVLGLRPADPQARAGLGRLAGRPAGR